MKKIIGLALAVFIIFFLVSCEDKEETADEIVEYYNEEWIPINEMKKEEMGSFSFKLAQLDEEGKTQEAANLIRNDAYPISKEVVKKYESVEPDNKKVKKLNTMDIEAESYANDSFKDTITYYEGGDISKEDLEEQNEKLKEKYEKVIEYQEKLMDKYNLEEVESSSFDNAFSEIKRKEN